VSTSARSKTRLTWGLALLMPATMLIASLSAHNREQSRIDAWLDRQAAIAADVVRERLNGVFSDLEAVAAFVEQTGPDNDEFSRFVDSIHGTEDAVAVGYLLEVPVERLDEYVAAHTTQLETFEIYGYDSDGSRHRIDVSGRDTLYPVEAFAVGPMLRTPSTQPGNPNEVLFGLDAGWNPEWRGDIQTAMAQTGPALSQFISVNIEVVQLDGVFLASVPVETSSSVASRGLVIAMMVEPLLLADRDTTSLEIGEWEVLTPGSSPTRVPVEDAHLYPLDVGGTTWSLALAPNDSALEQISGVPSWIIGLTTGLGAAALVISVWLYVDRRTQRLRATRAERIAADKDRFLASVSHELRTPLTVVTGLASELRDQYGSFTPDEQADITGLLADGAEELSNLVEDLLVAARTDIGKVSVHLQETPLENAVKEAMDLAGVAASTLGEPGVALADPQRVRQIIRNLLSNARRYGGPQVRIEFENDPGWTTVTVTDNGKGVPVAEREAIFQPYRSAHEPGANSESIGLGLYVSRALADAMGGSLTYSREGACSRFSLRLPASVSRPPTKHGDEEVLATEPV
jgi:signal transduction histidine kinase